MHRSYRFIEVEPHGDVTCVNLRATYLSEENVLALAGELMDLVENQGCRTVLLSLGPGEPECLYSVFLAKLVTMRRRLHEEGGQLKISDASLVTREVFQATQLAGYFDFVPDRTAGLEAFGQIPAVGR